MPELSAPCDITVVDFSHDRLSLQKLDNDTLEAFLARPQPDWAKCRWINVNGLSWDVIKVLGRHKNLHKLAIEDLMNTRNRTKAEWYEGSSRNKTPEVADDCRFPTHAFIVMTLQKLVHVYGSDSDESDFEDDALSRKSGLSRRSGRGPRKFFRRLRRAVRGRAGAEKEADLGNGNLGGYLRSQPAGFSRGSDASQLRTLQRYHASPDDPRTVYMEKHSALASRSLAVACEQVSLFLCSDNSIISFFEQSAQDVEAPIVRRLQTNDTIIRQ